ncbi:hypothetical protein FBR02_03810 [Anaerolineae bacterium CFX9]|nr:hypothetical protein [Anaerolineae bacterium CFX9]
MIQFLGLTQLKKASIEDAPDIGGQQGEQYQVCWWQSPQQACVSFMRSLLLALWMAACGFQHAEHLLRDDQKVDGVVLSAFQF